MIIDCISDLHGHYPQLEGGDLLILGGDYTASDEIIEWVKFFEWLKKQDYKKKILIGGNHDNWLCSAFPDYLREVEQILEPNQDDIDFEYLCDSGTEFEGLKIWGSPWTETFFGMNPRCKAFTVDTEEELGEKWALIPYDVDLLVTHCPPSGILDTIYESDRWGNSEKSCVGSVSLRNAVLDGNTLKNLKLHIFGHIHEWGGKEVDLITTKFINASHVNERYEPVNKPVRTEL